MQGILHAQTVFADISDGICRYFRRPYVMIPPYSTKTCPWINPFTSTQTAHAKATPAQAAGGYLCATAHTKRTVRRRSRNHQQPHGADRRYRRTEILKTPLPSRYLHRLAIRQKRHGKLDTRLEKKRLENRRQKTGQKTTIYGKSWIVWFNSTMSAGRGSKATPDTLKTKKPTSSLIKGRQNLHNTSSMTALKHLKTILLDCHHCIDLCDAHSAYVRLFALS